MSLKAGKEALAQKRYTEAIAILSQYCAENHQEQTRDYIQAQMWLVSAYQHIGRADKAITICEQFINHNDPQVQTWAKQALKTAELNLAGIVPPPVTSVIKSKPNRYRKNRVTLSVKPYAQLVFRLSMLGTIGLILGIIFGVCLGIISLITPTLTTGWLYVAIGTTAIASIILFFMSPWLIDITHKQFYRVQWITLADLDPKAPEAVTVIEEFCQARNIFVPKIGWIEDQSPVAFIYGVLPNSTRLILSRGLFITLDDDEIAAVVAQQLGHVANWSFAVVSLVTAPSQLIYLCHVIITRIGFKLKVGNYFWHICAAIPRYLYTLTSYLAFGVTRSSAYICDHFAAEATGNPNALSRALAKMARDTPTPSRLLESSVNFGTIDSHTSTSVGIVFQILYAGYSEVSRENLYKVFLWELFNPWAVWTELHSPQPLIGRRIRALTAYAYQLGLTEEYEFSQLLITEKSLNFKVLYKNFARDLWIETAPYTFVAIALITSMGFYWLYNNWLLPSLVAIALGLGTMLRGSLRYPDYTKVTATNLVNLLIDPYASSLRGKPVQVPGELVGYSIHDLPDYDLRLEDQSAILPLHYMPDVRTFFSDATPILTKLESLVGETVLTTGWFRRGNRPSFDVSVLQPISGDHHHLPLKSYHQLWNNLLSSVTVLGGLGLLAATSLF
ncbi:Zn-dependent protease with chaperone function [Synechococcus sp. PCC 7502]|uniref:M48 family metalloprotease n=1 Tax=Synechococcus sp. PCC 7502 TaxID=1173263 RepID=UPI00029F858E|nr:M48 family metalloprotease [Synechococcus sp. PCC 7502]AFY75225.1 Zn-dependent protease with chaperone function [Synechococcus sp. PCC 7502]